MGTRHEIKCPFYIKAGTNRLTCEGLTPGQTFSWMFQDGKDLTKQKKIFCRDKYKNCEICQILLRKYEED